MKRLCAFVCIFLASCAKHPRATQIRFAVQPPSTNNYPSHLAQWLGFYKDEGLDVAISQIAGASKVLEALVGASADVAGGVYEQSVQMAAEGRDVVSFVCLIRSPNFALLAMPGRGVETVADLKGKIAGVSSAGSPSQFYLNHLLARSGIAPGDVGATAIGMGATAVAAAERGQVDAAMLFGSAITALQTRHPSAVILADTRTPEGLRAVFGVDDYPASCLLARRAWLDANPEAARKMARAILRSLQWIRGHSAEEILAAVPPEFRVGDPAAELAAIRLAKPMYSVDGRIRPESAEAVKKVLAGSLENVRGANIDLSKTYTNEFVQP
ncbi:MAG TPA: ABC transporter substrate-binding protein [Bryobacteraceae bacterium]|nr:ABC transporter substrate-binding protein [Bryobacteraceae bacterium]